MALNIQTRAVSTETVIKYSTIVRLTCCKRIDETEKIDCKLVLCYTVRLGSNQKVNCRKCYRSWSHYHHYHHHSPSVAPLLFNIKTVRSFKCASKDDLTLHSGYSLI
ncbi:hypothetical protein V1478_001443 [Vespula squamosa]|uniref:Uncharacterized protein n=1 Tax=Vespula squamosa TaxID=30214 RepID=A0ABD2C1H0_VESSQ